MVRCEYLINPYEDDWLPEGAIMSVKPLGTRLSPLEWTGWREGRFTPDFTGVPANTQMYATRQMMREQRFLARVNRGVVDHVEFYKDCFGKYADDPEDALRFAEDIDLTMLKIQAFGWDSNYGFEELKKYGVLMFDAEPLDMREMEQGYEECANGGLGEVRRHAKRRYAVDYRAILSGASLANLLDLDAYVEPNRNLPTLTRAPATTTTLRQP